MNFSSSDFSFGFSEIQGWDFGKPKSENLEFLENQASKPVEILPATSEQCFQLEKSMGKFPNLFGKFSLPKNSKNSSPKRK
jgi:hypothetical protein